MEHKGEFEMLVRHVQKPLNATMFPTAVHQRSVNWQTAAIEAYRAVERDKVASMQSFLASRVLAFTGFLIPSASLHVDLEARVATAALDNLLFRLRREAI
jgi:hypothetical protein